MRNSGDSQSPIGTPGRLPVWLGSLNQIPCHSVLQTKGNVLNRRLQPMISIR